jgi:hypothetical protein
MKNNELRIKLAREGMTAIGLDPDDLGGAMMNPIDGDYAGLIRIFNLFVADEEEITPESAARARQRLRESMRALVEIARELKGQLP